jgi:MFS family permease
MLALGMASFCNDIVMPCAWGTCMDVGGRYAGTLAGSMNMMGNFAGFVSPFLGGVILQRSAHWDLLRWGWLPEFIASPAQEFLHNAGGWNLYLYTFVASYLLAAMCWPFLDSRRALDADMSVTAPQGA